VRTNDNQDENAPVALQKEGTAARSARYINIREQPWQIIDYRLIERRPVMLGSVCGGSSS
jgi:hypothetical protein